MKKKSALLKARDIKPGSILRMVMLTILFLSTVRSLELNGQRLSRDLNVDLLVNQVGYVPQAAKILVTKGTITTNFEVINLETQKVVFTGAIKPNPGDFGEYSTGDFTALMQEGRYYVKADTLRSYPFTISKGVYQTPLNLIISYFSLQRCGSSTTGYLSPCHLDDGIRMDNGKHQDVTGGWHDASDLRKWVEATLYTVFGLGKTYELHDEKNPQRERIIEELLWGNDYFLKMQEPQGYLMANIGGNENRWSDSEIGTKDDRIIRTNPVNMLSQFNFITSEAILARIIKTKDGKYSKKCLDAAAKCFDWCIKSNKETSPAVLGASIQAGIEMYKTTKQNIYRDFAVLKAAELKKLQAINQEGGVGGFFYTSTSSQEPYKHIWWGCFEFISLCDLIEIFPDHKDVPIWKEMITDYANGYLSFMSHKNSFGIIPYGLFTKQDPGGDRKVGNYWYRYFMQPELSWWVGINSNIASSGIGLMKAGRILNDPKLEAIAQKQLDWILGVNPFNSSTMITVGYNNPVRFINGGEFRPPVPLLPGAVMNGLGGDHNDQPNLITKNNWQQSEYWTPMVAFTSWLMAEISESE
jgi:hypothetical protein